MKLVIILGSRNPQGQTARAAMSLVEGAKSTGAHADMLFLPQMKIERCRQCEDNGWGLCRTEGRCVIDDDLPPLVEKIAAADAVIFATPVYFGDLSESMRTFTDRLRRTCRFAEGGNKAKVQGKKAVGVCVAGGGGGGAPSCCLSLERVLSTCGFDLVDIVPVRRQNLEMKLVTLRIVGQWLAGQLQV